MNISDLGPIGGEPPEWHAEQARLRAANPTMDAEFHTRLQAFITKINQEELNGSNSPGTAVPSASVPNPSDCGEV